MSWPVFACCDRGDALFCGGCWLLIKHWDTVKAAVMENIRVSGVCRGGGVAGRVRFPHSVAIYREG